MIGNTVMKKLNLLSVLGEKIKNYPEEKSVMATNSFSKIL